MDNWLKEMSRVLVQQEVANISRSKPNTAIFNGHYDDITNADEICL